MTNPIVSCELFADRLADYLERDTDESTRAGMEAHALSCADCGALLADLRALHVSAANLEPLVPSRDLWAGIAARIETPVMELPARGSTVAARRNLRGVWIGLAAAGLVAITATVTHELTKRTLVVAAPARVAVQPVVPVTGPALRDTVTSKIETPARRAAPAPTPERALASNRPAQPTALQTYDDEIARLRVVVNRRRPQLDSATVSVIEHNLKVIDDAIAQCKQALKKDPASRFLMESLNDAMDNKVQLLRTAAVLPTKM
ncbi:MAG: hypothetical protein JWM41_4957 [Gemmatimonadetes bacterium]|nr:hypothetical protein [Gemmatimonadota bacterium]